ncbi:hypothetical protein Nepgr_005973 [Nepenthes gracilis]|uniref:Uncharacterized protein n=1 Tax=Nepenthes gracilis TaxID=150966 RepID=A0AAD3S4K1_NEPGR|nr:hypothetical protein Nepgr_005973 [Nepenthes gracilis]
MSAIQTNHSVEFSPKSVGSHPFSYEISRTPGEQGKLVPQLPVNVATWEPIGSRILFPEDKIVASTPLSILSLHRQAPSKTQGEEFPNKQAAIGEDLRKQRKLDLFSKRRWKYSDWLLKRHGHGVKVDVPRKSYCTQLVAMNEKDDVEKASGSGTKTPCWKVEFLCESELLKWSSIDFSFPSSVPANHLSSHVLLQSPFVDDIDQRELFSIHILRGTQQHKKAQEMLSDTHDLLPIIFLVTDGAAADERYICKTAENHLLNWGFICPHIHTFSMSRFCNHYFLQMLSVIGRGHYDAACDTDYIESCLFKLFVRASSAIFANITIDTLDELDEVEVCPFPIPDISSESPLVISGRFQGNFPKLLKAKGIALDMKSLAIELKVQMPFTASVGYHVLFLAFFILLQSVAMQQIHICTGQTWFSEDKQLEEKVLKMSLLMGIVSKYTLMIFVESESWKISAEAEGKKAMDFVVVETARTLGICGEREGKRAESKVVKVLGVTGNGEHNEVRMAIGEEAVRIAPLTLEKALG